VINLVLFSLAFNVLVMAISFAIIAGIANFLGIAELSQLFGMATGFLMLLLGAVGVIRDGLVRLIEDLTF
jgi:hypothetical protein